MVLQKPVWVVLRPDHLIDDFNLLAGLCDFVVGGVQHLVNSGGMHLVIDYVFT